MTVFQEGTTLDMVLTQHVGHFLFDPVYTFCKFLFYIFLHSLNWFTSENYITFLRLIPLSKVKQKFYSS